MSFKHVEVIILLLELFDLLFAGVSASVQDKAVLANLQKHLGPPIAKRHRDTLTTA